MSTFKKKISITRQQIDNLFLRYNKEKAKHHPLIQCKHLIRLDDANSYNNPVFLIKDVHNEFILRVSNPYLQYGNHSRCENEVVIFVKVIYPKRVCIVFLKEILQYLYQRFFSLKQTSQNLN